MNAGFIGTGSMGSILIEAFIHSGALSPEHIIASNRTAAKVGRLSNMYPGLKTACSNREVIAESDIVFLCVKPLEYKQVLDEISSLVKPLQTIVSITSSVLIRHLTNQLPCKIVKIIPSITNYVLSGAMLCMYSERMLPEDIENFENLLTHISTPIRIAESNARICSDLSSCGPAFLSLFVQKFVDAAVQKTGISEEDATLLACEMVLGTGKLLTTGGFNPYSLQKRVAVPGGVTAEGLRMLDDELDEVFHQLVKVTHLKYEEDLEKVASLFGATESN